MEINGLGVIGSPRLGVPSLARDACAVGYGLNEPLGLSYRVRYNSR